MPPRIEPSKGSKPDKLMRDALMVALNREAITADGRPTKKLYKVAEALVDKAIDGDVPAIKEIMDRVDGKTLVQTELTGPGGEGLFTGIQVTFVRPDATG